MFNERGYEATSMRDIADGAGILAGSIYWHFSSKEELFLAAYGTALEIMKEAVILAVSGIEDHWDRFSAACVAHCEILHSQGSFSALITPLSPSFAPEIRQVLVAQRDEYEAIFTDLISKLDLPPSIDRTIFRLNALGALNWSRFWYRSGTMTPAEIAEQFVLMLRPGSRDRADIRAISMRREPRGQP